MALDGNVSFLVLDTMGSIHPRYTFPYSTDIITIIA